LRRLNVIRARPLGLSFARRRRRRDKEQQVAETKTSQKATRRRGPPQIASGERALALASAVRGRRSTATATPSPQPNAPDAEALLARVPPPAFFEESPDAIVRFDESLRVVYANPALERATAVARAEFIGRRLGEVEHFAAFAPLWESKLVDVLESEENRWFKFAFPHPTGRKLFDVRLAVEHATAGTQRHVTAVLRDVTVPKAALRESREAGDFIEKMLSAARIGVCVLDRHLRYRAWNAYLEELLGVPADAVIGRTPDEVPEIAGHPDIMRQLTRMRDGTLRLPQTTEYQFGGGRQPWLRVKRTPVYDARGRFDGVFITIERIDRERFAETSLAALRQALDSAGEMVLEIDRHGTVLDANETALAWLGYARDQLKGMPLAAIDASLTPEGFAEILAELDGRGAFHGEARYRTRRGSEFPVDLVLQRVEHGDREFIFGLVRDISDRKRIEAQLTDAVWRFRTVFEESPVANLLLDADFRIVQVNRAAGELVGVAAEELVGGDPAALLAPEDADAIARLRAAIASGAQSATEGDRRVRHRDGHAAWVKLTLRAWAGADGERHYLLVLENFTERKTAEEQLQVLLRDQQTLLETMTVGVVQALRGRILLANREFAQMFGYGDGEVIGMSLWDLCRDHANRAPNEVSGLPAVRPYQTTSAEVVLFRRDGEPIWCLVQARPIHSNERAAEGARIAGRQADEAIYTFQDVSEMKRQREALSRSLLELNVVLDTTSVAVLHLAGERVIRCNAQAYLMFGGDGVDLIGRRFAALFVSEAEYETQARASQTRLAGGELLAFEAQMRGRDGRSFWGLVSLRAVDPRTHSSGLIASILDISERKAQEAQLQTLLAESQLMFDTALVGLLFVRDGRPVRANSAMEELLACEPGGLVNQMQLFTHPTDQLLLASLAERYADINERGVCEFELHMFRRKGEPIWVAVQGRAVNPERPELGYIFAFVNVDERKRSERELRAALAELQLIFDNALIAMVYVAEELIVKANAATVRMFGYAEADLRELQIGTLFADPSDWIEVRALPGEAGPRAPLAAGEITFEKRMRRADGSTFWCAGNARPIDPAAPERGMILALMDVDLRRRSEDELKRVRNYLDLVVEHLPVLVSVRDAATGRFVSLNRAGESITGLTREQVIGRTWHEVYGRQFADLYAELDRKALAEGHQVERPRDVMLRADGRALTVNQRVVPLFETDAGGKPRARYVMSIIDDLTEEVRAEAALRETEARFRQFAENIDQLLFIATADLDAVLYVNPRYAALVGASPEELLDNPRKALAHVHFDDAPMVARALPRLVARMRRVRKGELTVRIDHPRRGVRMLHLRLNPVRMPDGVVRVFGVADDVTERTAAERQRIEEAVKQRDILVREVHHRIKNNLQGVAGLLQHMAGAKPELAGPLNEIAGQIQAIAQVHGLQIRATGTLPVLGVVQGIFTNLSNMFGVEVRFETPPPALWRWGLPENEAVPLALVINELGTNAIKYRGSRDQGVAVRVMAKAEGVELRIENAGALKPGFDLGRIASSVSGLGLVKALLPRRGARLAIEQSGGTVLTRLDLSPPAIGEDTG
jgi:PAS domain S-box-containing protein